VSQEQLDQINQRLIDESKPVAAVVALRIAGYQASITGEGAEVTGLVDGLPAADVLRVGDIIVAIDGTPTPTAADAVTAVQRHQPGDQLALTIQRDGASQDVTVQTVASPTDPTRAMAGVSIVTHGFNVDLPFPVEIDTSGVGGPSAGLMFTLGILDAVTDGDLTEGQFIAGTGTIAADGTVGPIGGAAEKVVGAAREGARVFFVPQANYDEARQRARTVTVVPVMRAEDAVRYLCGLEPPGSGERPSLCSSDLS
jgi:PDZ domain-containing protein